jgi:DNA-binding PadR family transcriptional regulator
MSVTDISATDHMPADPAAQLPLTPVVLHMLLALAGERQGKHGYALAREVEDVSEGQIRMGPGTLYGSIQRMIDSGLIEESSSRRAADDDDRRRYYRMTALGRRVLELEIARLHAVMTIARAKNLLPAIA